MRISVIGSGYVGLVSGVCLAESGHHVICVDTDTDKIARISMGDAPISEEGLNELLRSNLGRRFTATTDLESAVRDSELSMIAVGTPFDGDAIDLSHVRTASLQVGEALSNKPGFHVVLIKSTVVPGTTEEVVKPALEQASGKRAGVNFGLGTNPEFLRQGKAVEDFMQPDRIVLGAFDELTVAKFAELYAPFGGVDKLITSPRTAEMIKYASNSLFATMISFANEIGNLCASLGAIDVTEVMKGVHLDKRLSPIVAHGQRITPAFTTYLEAGCGFGGSCFPKDVRALIAHGKKAGREMSLLEAVLSVNERQPQEVLDRLGKHFPSLAGVRIAVLGLAFKPGTDDMRESPAIPIVRALLAQHADIRTYDPVAASEARKLFGNERIVYCDTLRQALDSCQAVILLTRWAEFNKVPDLLRDLDPQPVFVDGRRMIDKRAVARYEGIGMQSVP